MMFVSVSTFSLISFVIFSPQAAKRAEAKNKTIERVAKEKERVVGRNWSWRAKMQ